MQIQNHPLICPSLGTQRQITSFHYGVAGSGQKIYIQSSLHADELPGMLVSWTLRRKLAKLEAAGKLRGEVVIVPVANPIGLNQRWMGHLSGRFESGSAQNFNRNFHDLATPVLANVEACLTKDPDANRIAIRALMRESLQAQAAGSELTSQRLALQRLSFDADVVLDLHCDWEGAVHLYTSPELWSEVAPLARYIRAKASLLAVNSIGNPFDEVHSVCWSEIRKRFGEQFPIPNGSVAVTLELRGQRDVSYDHAEQDAQAIIDYLTYRGVIDEQAAPMPPLAFPETPLSGTETIVATSSGIVVYRVDVGVWVDAGTEIIDIVDPLTDQIVTLRNQIDGVLFARHHTRLATPGMELAHIAGKTPIRTGSLLSP